MALLVVAAFLGLFGDGPVSHATRTVGGRVTLEYQRFARAEAQTSLRVTVHHPGKEVRLTLSRDYADDVQLQTITPQPDTMSADLEGLTLTFRPRSSSPLPVELFVEPERPGLGHGRVLVDGAALTFQQLFWP